VNRLPLTNVNAADTISGGVPFGAEMP
jgi:hypothetical protein